MPLRTTDCRLLFGDEHAREIFAISASLRRTAEGDSHGSSVPAVLWAGCTQVVHHRLYFASAIRQTTETDRRFGCTTGELHQLVAWLQGFGVEHVAMESTGVYWKPVWNILEGHFQILLVNAQHIKAVPGRKTDTKDCQWIAELLQHGLLRGSFIPPVLIRDLRDLTRARTSLSQEHSRIASRIQTSPRGCQHQAGKRRQQHAWQER